MRVARITLIAVFVMFMGAKAIYASPQSCNTEALKVVFREAFFLGQNSAFRFLSGLNDSHASCGKALGFKVRFFRASWYTRPDFHSSPCGPVFQRIQEIEVSDQTHEQKFTAVLDLARHQYHQFPSTGGSKFYYCLSNQGIGVEFFE